MCEIEIRFSYESGFAQQISTLNNRYSKVTDIVAAMRLSETEIDPR